MLESPSRPIRFVHRGAIVEVTDAPTTQSVLYWLRERAHRTGTKEGCNEGDCGACMVLVGERDDEAPDGVALRPVNACLQFVSALDGRALITVEDLACATSGEPHPAQRAMVACHGSQCGFCTPGFVVSLAAVYDTGVASGARPDRQAIADALSGNLCRCTGYRPILDAGLAMFDGPGSPLDRRSLRKQLDALVDDPPLFHLGRQSAADADGTEPAWVAAPASLDALASLYAEHPDARLVAGATDVGLWVTKQFRPLPKLIRLDRVDALKAIVARDAGVSIGAGASLEAAWDTLVALAPALGTMKLRFASWPLRLAGTLGGNVANGSPIGDGPPVLLALDATLLLRRGDVERRLPLSDFYVDYLQNRLADGEFIASIDVPRPSPTTAIRAYKIGKRYDCDISAVSAAFAIDVVDGVVRRARIAFGGMAATCRRATATEAVLVGRAWDAAAVDAAGDALAQDFTPMSDLRGTASYRMRTAANLVRRVWLETRVDEPLSNQQVDVRAAVPTA